MADRSDDVNVHVELNIEQESEPPRTRLAVLVAMHLLEDVHNYLEQEGDDREHQALALLIRIGAVRAVLKRVHERLGD